MKRKCRISLPALIVLLIALALPVSLIWQESRQAQRNQVLIASRPQTAIVPDESVNNTQSLSALARAVQSNNTTLVQALTARGAKDIGEKLPTDHCYGGGIHNHDAPCSLLMYAARKGNVAVARCLLKSGSRVQTVDAEFETALTYASTGAVVDALMANGANVYAKNALRAYVFDENMRALRALLAYGVKNGNAMHCAIHTYNAPALKAFLNANWDVDIKDEEGATPLMTALTSGGHLNTEAALLLIKYGANVNFRGRNGRTPLLLASDGGRYPEMNPESPKVVQALLDRGANINARDEDGITPLLMAAYHLRPVIIRQLLRQGANVHARDREGKTALFYARHNVHAERFQEYKATVTHLLTQAGVKE